MQIAGLSRIRIRIRMTRNMDALPCRCQSFRQLWYKSAVDCMRNANKCPKIPYSATVKKTKTWCGIHTRICVTTRSYSLLEDHPLPMPAKFGRRPFPRSSLILFTVWQNDRQNDITWPSVGGGNKCFRSPEVKAIGSVERVFSNVVRMLLHIS